MFGTRIALAALALGASASASATVLVIRADGPTARRHYLPGTRLPDSAVFELRPGDTVTVVAGGGTRTFRGPGAFSVTRTAGPYVLANGQQVRINTGVVRAPMPEPGVDPTDLRELDTRQDATLCISAGGTAVLWRPQSATFPRLTIRTAAGDAASLSWTAGQTHLAWPLSLRIRDGGTYTLVRGAGSPPVRLTLRVLPASASSDLTHLSEALLARGCQRQVDTLIATRADPAATVAPDAAQGQNVH